MEYCFFKYQQRKVRAPNGDTKYHYPECWKHEKISVLAYEQGDGVGEVREWVVFCCDGAESSLCTDLIQSGAIEIRVAEAQLLLNQFRGLPRLTFDMVALGDILYCLTKDRSTWTQEELEMLDPDHPRKGLRRKAFNIVERLEKRGSLGGRSG